MKKISGAQRQARGIPPGVWVEPEKDFSQYHGDERNFRMIAHEHRRFDNFIFITAVIAIFFAAAIIIKTWFS